MKLKDVSGLLPKDIPLCKDCPVGEKEIEIDVERVKSIIDKLKNWYWEDDGSPRMTEDELDYKLAQAIVKEFPIKVK